MAMVITSTPMSTGIRSSEAPSPAARARPAVATNDNETIAAIIVPTIAQTARVSSAPKRRNHRKP